MEKIVVLSDLHIDGPDDPMYGKLLGFIDQTLNPGDKFFIVGDFFDLFVGNKKVFSNRHQELLSKLTSLPQNNIEVFYIEGNHDFHLRGLFKDSSVRLIPGVFNYEWDGRKFHFCHGDQINRKDYKYLMFRTVVRSLPSKVLVDLLPGGLIDRIGSMMSKASNHYYDSAKDRVMKMFRNYACDVIKEGSDFVVLGHSHFLDNFQCRIDDRAGQYLNVGFPKEHKKYLQLVKGEKAFTLEDLL